MATFKVGQILALKKNESFCGLEITDPENINIIPALRRHENDIYDFEAEELFKVVSFKEECEAYDATIQLKLLHNNIYFDLVSWAMEERFYKVINYSKLWRELK